MLAVRLEGGGGVLEREVELAHAEVAFGAVSKRGGVGGVGGDGLAVLDRRGAVIPRAEQLVPRVAERIALFRRAGAFFFFCAGRSITIPIGDLEISGVISFECA